jgi:NAD(P)H-dependent FMN reductase
MKILAVYGNPRSGGFVHGCTDAVAERLKSRGAEVDRLRLAEIDMKDCTGCFACLGTGRCVIDDDMNGVIERIRAADGLVIGASVRNGLTNALFKRFYERITYTILFCGDITDKYVLGISAVGMAGGKAVTRRLVGMSEMGGRTVDHLFFRTGIPTKLRTEDVADRLARAADRLYDHISRQRSPGLLWRLRRRLDRAVMSRLMFKRNPDLYANVIRSWRERGWMA